MFIALEVSAVSFNLRSEEIPFLPFIILIIFGFIVIMPAALLRRWYFYKRRLSKNIITAEYEPPLGLNPAEIGYLFDGKLRELEVGATIIHLMQRGLLHVKKIDDEKRIFSGPRVEKNLKAYEKKLIDEADTSEGVLSNDLLSRFTSYKSDKFSVQVMSREIVFTQLVHFDLLRRQYVKRSFALRFLISSFKINILLVGIIIYIPLIGVWMFGAVNNGATDFMVLGILLVAGFFISIYSFVPFYIASMILNYFRGRIVGREWIITPKLQKLWPQIVGYRQYIKMVENEKLEFSTKALAEVSKNKSLPYAIALGFVKNWRDII